MKCKNCSDGTADGGFKKRIRNELKQLEYNKEKEINWIKNSVSNKEKRIMRIKNINSKYNILIHKKTNETCKRIGKCFYCRGYQTRGKKSVSAI